MLNFLYYGITKNFVFDVLKKLFIIDFIKKAPRNKKYLIGYRQYFE